MYLLHVVKKYEEPRIFTCFYLGKIPPNVYIYPDRSKVVMWYTAAQINTGNKTKAIGLAPITKLPRGIAFPGFPSG